jgi:hypothetical protein
MVRPDRDRLTGRVEVNETYLGGAVLAAGSDGYISSTPASDSRRRQALGLPTKVLSLARPSQLGGELQAKIPPAGR